MKLDIKRLLEDLDIFRRAKNLSWRQLAKSMEVDQSMLSRIKDGQRGLNAASAMRIVSRLGTPPERYLQ